MVYPSLPSAPNSNYLSTSTKVPRSSESASSNDPEPVTPELNTHSNMTFQHQSQSLINEDTEELRCKWSTCTHVAGSPDELYDHLCNAHVGRKSTNNLCLTCGWENCGVKCVKRDHITSHLRVHTPLKPHPCSVCSKTFKRPQDLKKHERIHTQEHHQMHKLSKAATSTDPKFNSRVSVGNIHQPHIDDRQRSPLSSNSLSPSSSASSRSQLNPSSPFDHLLQQSTHLSVVGGQDKSVSPSPSALAALHRKQHEELAAYQQREMAILQQLAYNQQQTQAYAAQLAAGTNSSDFTKIGMKRSQDSEAEGLQGLLADMKKRKVEPVYDAEMMHRLNNLVPPSMPQGYPQIPSSNGFDQYTPPLNPSVNAYPALPTLPGGGLPSSMSSFGPSPPLSIPEIKTEADLQMFNEFMISLGRDASGQYGNHVQSMMHTASGGGGSINTDSPLSDASNGVEDLFNPEELASLGLTGMPGIPIPGTHHDHVSTSGSDLSHSLPNESPSISFGGMYPSLEGMRHRTGSASEITDHNKRPIAGLPRASTGSLHPVPSINSNNKSSYTSNFYGLGATQYAELPFSTMEYSHNNSGLGSTNGGGIDNFSSFDSLARSKQNLYPAATLAPKDFYKKTYRHVQPLGASLSARARESAERGTADHEEDDEDELIDEPEQIHEDDDDLDKTPKIPVRSLLSAEDSDPDLKLPAIASREANGSPTRTLPSISEINHYRSNSMSLASSSSTPRGSPAPSLSALPVKRHTEEEIVRGVKRLELGSGESVSVEKEEDKTAMIVREMRKRHAQLIRSWLIAVNLEFRRKKLEEIQRLQREREREEEDRLSEVDELEEREIEVKVEIPA
ncbi:uncharacterized protein I303_102987 [Kwoniella dejecticola CBS 10117]|uniref:C2H2-type domain-containing protein n=1 Tax=Kwoniella dejecticola CBS 10117 TaxID=1296121 RepID=A0A1A6AAA3_9TREE|nr:uncharacterized protein I303_03007 [Kwoniella dejecticola CBS 10117]OBR86985.1 hypothetical protein I303_03007 [Kwoniella dejecticola CBS 10117]